MISLSTTVYDHDKGLESFDTAALSHAQALCLLVLECLGKGAEVEKLDGDYGITLIRRRDGKTTRWSFTDDLDYEFAPDMLQRAAHTYLDVILAPDQVRTAMVWRHHFSDIRRSVGQLALINQPHSGFLPSEREKKIRLILLAYGSSADLGPVAQVLADLPDDDLPSAIELLLENPTTSLDEIIALTT